MEKDHFNDHLKYIEIHTGKNITNLLDAFFIYQILHCQENLNLTLPEWSRSVYPSILQDIAGKQCEFENGNTVLRRLNGGSKILC